MHVQCIAKCIMSNLIVEVLYVHDSYSHPHLNYCQHNIMLKLMCVRTRFTAREEWLSG